MASAAGSLFARVYAGHTGVDPYTTAVSDTYQDLFGEGIYTGKGLYDVDTFMAALDGRVPENALLSHDLFEGVHARTALVTDVEVVDDYPSSVLAHARRQHRWVRGDWQILGWLLPWVRTREGLERNPLPFIARWKIFDNLRRSLVPPATLALLAAAWTVLPGRRWAARTAGAVVARWLIAPLAASWLSRPVPSRRVQLAPAEVALLRRTARKTWRYFETFVNAESHHLPPDNFQEYPGPMLARRTSPTNIGLGLLSTLAAHDFGFIRTSDMVARLEGSLSPLEGLERFEGHVLNSS